MGEVWLARERSSGALRAVKLVRSEVLAGDTVHREFCIQRLQCEARALGKLRSPNIVRIFDSGVTRSGAFYYAMEYLEGTSLDRLIRNRGPLAWEQATPLLRDIGTALAEAHAHGLVHCDVSPGNVFVCDEVGGTITKLLDFGMVRREHDTTMTTRISLPLIAGGTPAYMAPELVLGRPDIDHRADIYSWACVAYLLLTSHTVFEGDSPIAIAIRTCDRGATRAVTQDDSPDPGRPWKPSCCSASLKPRRPAGPPCLMSWMSSTPFSIGNHRRPSITQRVCPRRISRSSHRRATAQSRETVSDETPSTSAVSSTVSPPKYRSSTTWLSRGSFSARREARRSAQSVDRRRLRPPTGYHRTSL
jgi:serine/threonine protein kinase